MLRNIAFVTLISVGIAAALFNRFAALLVYVWFALFRPQEWVWADISRFHLSLVLGFLLVVPSLFCGIFPNITHPLSVGAVCFLGTALLAQRSAFVPDLGWEWLNFLARLLLVSLLAVTLVSNRRRFVLMVAVLAGSLGFHAAKAGVASLLGGGVRFAEGLGGSFGDNNGYALAVVMIIPLLFAAGQNVVVEWPEARWARAGFIAAAVMSMLTVISTFSRAGFLALAAAALTMVALQRRRLAVAMTLLAASLVLVPMLPIPAGYLERLRTIRTYEEVGEDSALSRLHFWRVTMDMAQDHPLGVGLRNFEAAYDQYDSLNGRYGSARAVHSSHFQALAETGYAGFLVWVALFAVAFRTLVRIRGRSDNRALPPDDRHFLFSMSNALTASMIGFIVGGSFIAAMLNDITWYTFALVAALDRLSVKLIEDAAPGDVAGTDPGALSHAYPSG